ncbi:MAG: hypothetical protein ACYC0V_20580 [Armatimonadota bacterium]
MIIKQTESLREGDGFRVIASSIVPPETIFRRVSEAAGFHVYYPTFTPEDAPIDRQSIHRISGFDVNNEYWDNVSFFLGGHGMQREYWITVNEYPVEQSGKIDKISRKLLDKKSVPINGQAGYTGYTLNKNTGELFTNELVFTTDDGTTVWLNTIASYYDISTLVGIAESMR